MTVQRRYSDFDLVVERSTGTGYRARVVDSPAGEASGSFTIPFSDLELENFLLRVGRPRRGTRRLESGEMHAAREFGQKLFDAVFQDDLRLSLRLSLDEVERRGEGLRIRLRFSDTPELASLPWEFLYSEADDEFLVLSAWTPIVRYLDLTQRIEPLTVTGPLRILVMISSPEDYPALDVEDEWNRIESALAPLIERGAVVIDRADDATLLELQRRLRRHEYHIFHYLGHGGFDEKSDDGVLVLEDDNNRSRLVAGRDLGTILQDHRSLRLAVLNACEGARASDSDPFSGAAQSLVRKGIPAVVAMQFEITDDAAIAFASEFYTAIAEGLPVDAAIGESRRAIFALGNDIEWGTPVVYLRGDGRLFEVQAGIGEPAGVVAVSGVDAVATSDTVESDVTAEVEDGEAAPSETGITDTKRPEPSSVDTPGAGTKKTAATAEGEPAEETTYLPAETAESAESSRSRWPMTVAFVVIAAVFGVAGWLLFGGTDQSSENSYGSVAEAGVALANEAAEINDRWDRLEGELVNPERNDLFGETLAGLEGIRARTRSLRTAAEGIDPTASEESARAAILSALGDMVHNSQEMIDGLHKPVGDKKQRQTGLEEFRKAALRLASAIDSAG